MAGFITSLNDFEDFENERYDDRNRQVESRHEILAVAPKANQMSMVDSYHNHP